MRFRLTENGPLISGLHPAFQAISEALGLRISTIRRSLQTEPNAPLIESVAKTLALETTSVSVSPAILKKRLSSYPDIDGLASYADAKARRLDSAWTDQAFIQDPPPGKLRREMIEQLPKNFGSRFAMSLIPNTILAELEALNVKVSLNTAQTIGRDIILSTFNCLIGEEDNAESPITRNILKHLSSTSLNLIETIPDLTQIREYAERIITHKDCPQILSTIAEICATPVPERAMKQYSEGSAGRTWQAANASVIATIAHHKTPPCNEAEIREIIGLRFEENPLPIIQFVAKNTS